jgi:site-specific recombinase XerD
VELGGVDRLAIRSFMGDCAHPARLAKRSVARKLSAVRSFFRFLHLEELSEANPARSVRSPEARADAAGLPHPRADRELFRAPRPARWRAAS